MMGRDLAQLLAPRAADTPLGTVDLGHGSADR
jgi:hypothetical protein